MWLRVLQVIRVEALVADWVSLPLSLLIAMVLAALARDQTPGLVTQGNLIRFSLAALSVGVVLFLEDAEGEATAAMPTGIGLRLLGRLVVVGSAWMASATMVLGLSGISPTYIPRLAVEAIVLTLVSVLLGAVGMRTLVPHFTTAASLALATGLVIGVMLPASVNPWWNGVDPTVEPDLTWWYSAGGIALASIAMVARRSALWLRRPQARLGRSRPDSAAVKSN